MLVVGLGSIGALHLRLARKLLPDSDIRVLRHRYHDAAPEHADGCFSSLDEAIKFAPQLAVIANPASMHLSVAKSLAQVGAHLLIEKPLSSSAEGVSDFLYNCRQYGVTLLVGYNLRFLRSLQVFRDLVQQGAVGHVLSVRSEIGQYLPSWRPGTDYRIGVSARHDLGGGVLLELSHELDYLRWIFGEVASVNALLSRQSELEIDVEDSAYLALRFVAGGAGRQLVATVNMDFIRHDTTRVCLAIGEKGSLRWNGISGLVEQLDAGTEKWQKIFQHQHQRDESYLFEWQHLLDCLSNQQCPSIPGEDGQKVLQIITAARESSEIGKWVAVSALP